MEESSVDTLMQIAQRLEDAAASLETAAARVLEREIALAAKAEDGAANGATIVATVDTAAEEQRFADLERRLQEAEQRLVAFHAAAMPESGRKTAAAGVATMLAKQEGDGASFAAHAVDGALATLSIEQRIAVKAELLRSGLIG
jgi:exonuclease VII small subunit